LLTELMTGKFLGFQKMTYLREQILKTITN
jgi:hypothetical protein